MNSSNCDSKTYDTEQLAKALGCSSRHIANMDAGGLLPAPIRLGRLKRWPISQIDNWMKAGSPSRKEWEASQ
ncbi:helix-turn-helix transcriptional regulator [Thalassoglobus sp.]|uniref:helix-turn-helix transcriptional regulator n=1 Tax=Thalassoglobus sp. TaxID=2795869 RepID=UPI003AA87EE5